MNKSAIVQSIVAALREEFENFQTSSRKTRAAGNDAESKSEGKYDTRSIEENYLADGLAMQAQAAVEAAAAYEKLILTDYNETTPIDLGALICLEFSDETSWFFLGPAGGGIEVRDADTVITVFTPESPLGRQVLDQVVGYSTQSPKARIIAVA